MVGAPRRKRLSGADADHVARPIRLLALGDSYTIGEGVSADEAWPARLAAALRAEGFATAEPTILAATGWASTELAQALDRAALTPPYALVTLLIGVNDQYRNWPETEFPARHAALLDHAIALAGGRAQRCLAISIPDWSMTPFAARDPRGHATIAAAIDRYNAVVRANAAARGVAFVDVTQLSRDPELAGILVADALHPAAAQYQAWVERAIGPAAFAALRL